MTLSELKEQRDKLNKAIQEQEEAERRARENDVLDKINNMSEEEKRVVLSFMSHDRTSCDDNHIANGYSSSDNSWRCRKCMFMEILNGYHGGRFDFNISVDIWEV